MSFPAKHSQLSPVARVEQVDQAARVEHRQLGFCYPQREELHTTLRVQGLFQHLCVVHLPRQVEPQIQLGIPGEGRLARLGGQVEVYIIPLVVVAEDGAVETEAIPMRQLAAAAAA